MLKWFPIQASAHAAQIDQMTIIMHWAMLALFVGWGSFFLFTVFRFNRKWHPRADYAGVKSHFSSYLEGAVALFEAAVNVMYMAGRASQAAVGGEPISAGMRLMFAAHGMLSLLAYLAFVVLGVFAYQDQKQGRYFFPERPALTWSFLVVWVISIVSGEALFAARYLL